MVLISVTCSVLVTLISQPNVQSCLCSSLSGFPTAVITDVQTIFGCSMLLKINVSYIMAGRTDFVRVSYYKVWNYYFWDKPSFRHLEIWNSHSGSCRNDWFTGIAYILQFQKMLCLWKQTIKLKRKQFLNVLILLLLNYSS